METKKYDLIVFGATGFTGQYVVGEAAKVAKLELEKYQRRLTWAIAGRSREKLESVLESAGKETEIDLKNVEILIADIDDESSLDRITSDAKVIVNCVGPYQKYGEPVIKACIKNGANHVDISGEHQFLEGMQLKYNKVAEEAGVHIVGSCGLDSIPANIGVNYLIKKFNGCLNSVAQYFMTNSGRPVLRFHTGTMESAGLMVANYSQLSDIRSKLFKQELPEPKYKEKRSFLHYNDKLRLYGLLLPSDEPVVERSMHYRYESSGAKPVQYQGFVASQNVFQALCLLIGMSYFAFMAYFSLTRKFLFKFPEYATAGIFSRAGPSRESLKKVGFTSVLIGKGWSEQLAEGSDEYSQAPDSTAVLKISGSDPAYSATALMMVACAMTILREKKNLPGRGGILPPGAAFFNTSIDERLQEQGLTFKFEWEKQQRAT